MILTDQSKVQANEADLKPTDTSTLQLLLPKYQIAYLGRLIHGHLTAMAFLLAAAFPLLEPVAGLLTRSPRLVLGLAP